MMQRLVSGKFWSLRGSELLSKKYWSRKKGRKKYLSTSLPCTPVSCRHPFLVKIQLEASMWGTSRGSSQCGQYPRHRWVLRRQDYKRGNFFPCVNFKLYSQFYFMTLGSNRLSVEKHRNEMSNPNANLRETHKCF